MQKTYLFILGLLLSLTLISTASCKQGASSGYPVMESGYNAFKKTHWVDNDRVIFSGYPSGLHKNNDKKGLYIWNTKTGKVKFHAKLSKSNTNFCYGDNVIVYDLEKLEDGIEKHIYMEGPLGEEQISTSYQLDPDNGQMSLYTCIKEAPPPELKDHKWDPMKLEHGYLDYGPRLFPDEHSKIRFLRVSDKQLITLPIKRREALGIKYIAFQDAYFIYNIFGSREDWKKTRCKTFWWLYPDGRVEDICVPYSPMEMKPAHLPFFIQPTANGMLLQGSGFKDEQGKVIEGSFYILNKNGPHVIDRGLVGAYSVSPNGCNVAYSQVASLDEAKRLGGHQLKMVNICTNNGTGEK